MGVQSRPVQLTPQLRAVLEQVLRAHSTPQQLAERIRIVLMSDDQVPNDEQARRLGVDVQRVRRWRNRWVERQDEVAAALSASQSDSASVAAVTDALQDAERSGAPAKFSAEQVAQIVALACTSPEENGLPVSHWTAELLAEVAIGRGIVETISVRHVQRVLKRSRSSTAPHKILAERED